MSIITDHSTVASNPGATDISLKKFGEYYDLNAFQRFKLRRYSKLSEDELKMVCKKSRLALLYVLTKEKFKYGCINPAVIVNPKKGLVAAFTSLTAWGDETRPVVKIYKERLDMLFDFERHKGQKLVTVAFYRRPKGEDSPQFWADFEPQVLRCFVEDGKLIQDKQRSIKAEAWQALTIGLRQIKDKKPGLYRVEVDSDLVRNSY